MARYKALDALRGLTVALMILVNTPGSWEHIYWPFEHSDWNGCTPTDLVFPFFLFIVGSAMFFAFRKIDYQLSPDALIKAFKRGGLLFLIGVGLNALNMYAGDKGFDQLRIMGVLQRIGIAYAFAAVVVLSFGRLGVLLSSAGLLLGYWVLLAVFGGADPYSLEENAVAKFDVAILGASHMWAGKGVAFDPEGILSTIPAIVSVLLGFEATRYLTAIESKQESIYRLIGLGIATILIGVLWNISWPINKSLWSGSYVVLTTGWALIVLAVLVWLMDIRGAKFEWTMVFGMNPLFIYVLSWVWVVIYYMIPVGDLSLYDVVYGWFNSTDSPSKASSLLFALVHVYVFWLVGLYLYKKKIVIKL